MRQILFSIVALLASVTVLLVGNGLMGTLVSVRLTLEAVDPQVRGIIFSAYYVGLVAGSQWAGRIIHHVGHIRAFATFAALCTAAILLQGLVVLPAVWFGLRMLIGFSAAGLYMVVESWLSERASTASRGRVFSVYQILSYVGLGIGQLLLPLGDPASMELFMVVAVLFALCLIPVALSRASTPPEPAPHTPMALRQTIRGSPLATWTCLASGLTSGIIFAVVPAFGIRVGLDLTAVSWLMASLILGGVILQWPIGHLSDYFGRQPLILAVGAATAALCTVIGLYADVLPLWALLVTAASFGGVVFTLYPLAVSQANDRIRSGSGFVAVAAALLFIWGVAAALGPITGGWVMSRFGDEGLFLFMAGIGALTSLAALIFRGESTPAREPYRTMARSTPVIIDLDPRAHTQTESTPELHEDSAPENGPNPSPSSDPDDAADGDFPAFEVTKAPS